MCLVSISAESRSSTLFYFSSPPAFVQLGCSVGRSRPNTLGWDRGKPGIYMEGKRRRRHNIRTFFPISLQGWGSRLFPWIGTAAIPPLPPAKTETLPISPPPLKGSLRGGGAKVPFPLCAIKFHLHISAQMRPPSPRPLCAVHFLLFSPFLLWNMGHLLVVAGANVVGVTSRPAPRLMEYIQRHIRQFCIAIFSSNNGIHYSANLHNLYSFSILPSIGEFHSKQTSLVQSRSSVWV